MDEIEIPEHIRTRYLFKTVGHPEGELTHPTHCTFFTYRICTCGLIADLIRWAHAPRFYPKIDQEYDEHRGALEKSLTSVPDVAQEGSRGPKKARGKRGRKKDGAAQGALFPKDHGQP